MKFEIFDTMMTDLTGSLAASDDCNSRRWSKSCITLVDGVKPTLCS